MTKVDTQEHQAFDKLFESQEHVAADFFDVTLPLKTSFASDRISHK